MKKICSLITFMIIITGLYISAIASNVQENILFENTFDELTLNTVYSITPSYIINPIYKFTSLSTNATATVVATPESTGQSVKFTTINKTWGPYLEYWPTSGIAGDNLIIEYKVRFSDLENVNRILISIRGRDSTKTTRPNLVALQNGTINVADSDGNLTAVMTPQIDKWYTISAHINSEAQTFDLYINNELMRQNGKINLDADNDLTKISTVLLYQQTTVAPATSSVMYVDNFRCYTDDKYNYMRNKWSEYLTGGSQADMSDAKIAAAIADITSVATTVKNSMNMNVNRTYLWSDASSETVSADITLSYQRLRDMAIAYCAPKSTLYNNATLKGQIVDGLQWLYANRYNTSKSMYSNWWDWQIGVPVALVDVLLLMGNQLNSTDFANYVSTIDYFLPDPNMRNSTLSETGANRAWKCYVKIVEAVATNNETYMLLGVKNLLKLNNYSLSGDGIYPDGSFIQHNVHPYTGGYGAVMLNAMANSMYIINGTSYDFNDDVKNEFCIKVEQGFMPLLYKGLLMDMVRGREIYKYSVYDHEAGCGMLGSMLQLSKSVNEPYKSRLQSFVKTQVKQDTVVDFYDYQSVSNIITYRAVDNDVNIPLLPDVNINTPFNSMARVVHRGVGYAFGVSMSSKRVSYYEGINNQNPKGWFTGFGMTYLYDADTKQFDDRTWLNIDTTRLPGTTVSRAVLADYYGQSTVSTQSFAGGASIGEYGVCGMMLSGYNANLFAKKSYFMFDDEIVALGSDISGSDGNMIETIVENKRLYGSSEFNVNGITTGQNSGWNDQIANANWAYIENNLVRNLGTGYAFGSGTTLNGTRNMIGSKEYLTMYMQHGVNPVNGQYEYAILPNRTKQQVQDYSANRQYTVLANNTDVHMVRENNLNVTAANFWSDKTVTSSYITCNKKASVIIKENNGILDVAVCDPTNENSGYITLILDKIALSTLSSDAQITVISNNPLTIKVNVASANGSVFKASFKVYEEGSYNLPYVSIVRPSTQSSAKIGENLKIIVDTFSVDNQIAKIEYFCDDTKIGEDISLPYVLNWNGVQSGFHILTAKATDKSGKVATSDSVIIRGSDLSYNQTSEKDYVFHSYTGSDGNTPPVEFGTYSSGNGNIYGILNSDGYQVKMTQSSIGTGASGSINFSPALTGIIRFDTKIKVDNKALTRNVLTVVSASSQNTTFIKFADDGNIYKILTNGQTSLVFQYQTGVWYDIQLEIDMSAKTYCIYMDNVCVSARATLPNSTNFSLINSVGFSQSSLNTLYGEYNISYLKVRFLSKEVTSKIAPVITLDYPLESPLGYIRLTANVKDLDAGVTRVEFYSDNKLIGFASKVPYIFDYYEAVAGDKNIYAQVIDDGGSIVASGIASLKVTTINNPLPLRKEIRVLSCNFNDTNGYIMDQIPLCFSGDINISLQNNYGATTSFDLYSVVYREGKLIRIAKSNSNTILKNYSSNIKLSDFDMSDVLPTDKIKLIIWNANYNPLSIPTQIEIGGATQ